MVVEYLERPKVFEPSGRIEDWRRRDGSLRQVGRDGAGRTVLRMVWPDRTEWLLLEGDDADRAWEAV